MRSTSRQAGPPALHLQVRRSLLFLPCSVFIVSFYAGGGSIHGWGTLMWPNWSGQPSQWLRPTLIECSLSFRAVKQIVIAKSHALLLTGADLPAGPLPLCCDCLLTPSTGEGEVFAFGEGKWGKLGNGSTKDEVLPRKLGFDLTHVKADQIAAGEDHSIVLTRKETLLTLFMHATAAKMTQVVFVEQVAEACTHSARARVGS